MAQRFGGRFSPGGGRAETRPTRRAATRMGARRNLLYVAPLPLLLTAFGGGALELVTDLGALAVLLGAAFLLGEGIKAEDAWRERKVARRPAVPRKLFAALLTGIGVALAAYGASGGVIAPAIFGAVAGVLHVASFGPDPMRNKGMEDLDRRQSDRVARAVDEAEGHLGAMRRAIARTGDRRLETRVERFQETAREMFRTVEQDPRDLTAARRYLGVYLLGARDATEKFAEVYARGRDRAARDDYESLLDDLETSYAARTEKLMLDDRSDLDVEIDVLRDRLAREGVRSG